MALQLQDGTDLLLQNGEPLDLQASSSGPAYEYTGDNVEVVNVDGFDWVSFKGDGTFTPLASLEVEILCVGGGGSGATFGGGGGGGGGVVWGTVTSDKTYTATVGTGGAQPGYRANGNNGTASSVILEAATIFQGTGGEKGYTGSGGGGNSGIGYTNGGITNPSKIAASGQGRGGSGAGVASTSFNGGNGLVWPANSTYYAGGGGGCTNSTTIYPGGLGKGGDGSQDASWGTGPTPNSGSAGGGQWWSTTPANGIQSGADGVIIFKVPSVVLNLPVITQQPTAKFSLDGELTTFTCLATGDDPLTYQWYETTAGLIVGATNFNYSFNPTITETGNTYYCIVTDTNLLTTQSNSALLTIVTAPTVVTDPQPTMVIEFRDATFTVAATGNTPFVYDWYGQTAGLLEAAGTTSFTYAPVLADDGELIYCRITDIYSKVTNSADALLTVVDANHPDPGGDPLLDSEITGPADVSGEVGEPITLTVTITSGVGVAPYIINWYNDIDGLVEADGGETIMFTAPTLAYGGSKWWVTIEDSQGYYGQSGQANMAILGAQLELSWSMEDGSREQTVVQYQSIAWSLYDAKTAGEYEGFQCPQRTHRGISAEDGHTYWIPFYDKSARCQRGPLVNDKYNRYYWTQDDQDLRYDTLQNLEWDSFTEGYDVGVPPPEKVVAISSPEPTEGSSAATETLVTRAYVYTYVSVYGEEGPPSAPSTGQGLDNGIWQLSNMLTGPVDGKRRKLTSKNIYRTVPSVTGTAEFHFVAKVSINTTVFSDDAIDADIALNYILPSTLWFPPPEGLSGLTAHPNGFFIGFIGRDIYFTEPYRPHAWNPNYTISTLGDVVSMGIFGTTVVVGTTSFPHTMNGIHPAAMVITQHDTPEPCLSRYGMVSMPFGVYYPGPNGLMLASAQGFSNATKELMTKEEWQNRYQVKTFDAARYQSQYVAFYSKTKGIMFAPDEQLAALVDLDLTGGTAEPDEQDSIFTDEYSGKTYLLSACDMYEWNPVSGAALEFDWTSMEFDAADPVNFGASRIIWYSNYTPPSEEETWAWRLFSTARMAAAPLMPMNFNVTNGVNVIPGLTYDLGLITDPEVDQVKVQEYLDAFQQIKQAFHWGPLVWTPVIGEQWPNTPYVIMELIANGEVVFTKQVGNTNMFRLPSGFKATRFKIRLRSNINIQSVKVAETGKELAGF